MGDPAAWKRMKKYNVQDVVVLEQLYERTRPWMKRAPNLAAYVDDPEACPKCGASKTLQRRGQRPISGRSYRVRYQCTACGGYSQSRKTYKTSNDYI